MKIFEPINPMIVLMLIHGASDIFLIHITNMVYIPNIITK